MIACADLSHRPLESDPIASNRVSGTCYSIPMPSLAHLLRLAGGLVYSVAFFGAPLFLGAWTFHWPRAWIFLGVVLALAALSMLTVFWTRPELLSERYGAPLQKEQPLADKLVTLLLVGSFFGAILFIPLDVFHFHLLGGTAPWVAALGLALFVGGWIVEALVLRANAFAAPVVKLQAERGHRVIDTGPYAIVRHPMYAGALPLMIGMPLWLGSVAGVLGFAVPIAAMVLRLRIEERFLRRELEGYEAYTRKIPWRLVPGVW